MLLEFDTNGTMRPMINLDANAGLGLLPEFKDQLDEEMAGVLNPSSIHKGGQAARARIEEARERIGKLIGLTKEGRIIFTSGATESNNTAIRTAAERSSPTFVSTSLEHPSVLEPLNCLKLKGTEVLLSDYGKSLAEHVSRDTSLVSTIYANNETGEITPLKEICSQIRDRHPTVPIHTDGVQALGKLPFDISELGVNLMSLSGHKIGALSGVGALVLADSKSYVSPFLLGGPQETHFRAGTENVAGIVSFGIAAERIGSAFTELTKLRDELEARLTSALPNIRVNTSRLQRLPNTSSITIRGIRADDLVVALDLKGILISSGAACASGKPQPSHVLLAMGISADEASQTIRISLPPYIDEGAVSSATETIIETVVQMRNKAAA